MSHPSRRRALVVVVALAVAAALPAQQPARTTKPSVPAPSATEAWQIVPVPQSSLVYGRDGTLIGEIGKEWRTSVPLKTLPRYIAQAFIAVEDKRFYDHSGVDVIGMAGAIKDALGGHARGASTITQLLVGNMHPDLINRRDRSIARKLREQSAAREMERHYTKEQILEAFLNQVDFGHGWYGIEAAARHYFGKQAAHLTLAEAASLAAMPKGPATYDPARKPGKNLVRRNTVLALMADQGFISKEVAEQTRVLRVITVPNGGMSAPSPYFIDVVRIQAERAGVPVTQGGYKLYTTLDPALQRAAVISLVEGAIAIEGKPNYKQVSRADSKGRTPYLQGAVVALDAATGDVRALVGGRNYGESQFDRAVDGMRQPGSSIKPFVYATAIAAGLTPLAVVPDTALEIPLPDGTTYSPKNADGKFLGDLTLREAITLSRNPVAVQLWMKYGPDSIIALAARAGLESPIAPYPSSALGASVVQPLNLVTAYAAIANLGTAVTPRFVVRVEDHAGRTVWTQAQSAGQSTPTSPTPRQLDPRVAFVLRDMMRDVVERGTGSAVRRYVPPRIPVAGKTGTTDDNTDVWFVGMTPEIVAGVWLGFDRPKPIAKGAAGGTLAAPIWGRMIGQYYAGRTAAEWPLVDGVVPGTFDRDTHMLATVDTPVERRYTEYFVAGTQPREVTLAIWRQWRFEGAPVAW